MKSLLLSAVASIALTGAAWAQAVLIVKDGNGAPVNIAGHNGGGSNFWGSHSICDPGVFNQCAAVDPSGRLSFLLAGTPSVSVNGVATASLQQATIGPVTPGVAAASSQLAGCTYNATPPAPSSTQQLATQCDNQGDINVNINKVTGIVEGSSTTGATGALVMGTVITAPAAFSLNTAHMLGMNPNGDLRADNMVTQGSLGAPTLAHICGNHVTVNPTTATNTVLVPPIGGKTVYACDYNFSSNGVNNFYLESNTAGSCGGTLAAIDTVWYGAANTAKTDANPYYRGLSAPVGSGICLNTSAAQNLSFTLYFDQY